MRKTAILLLICVAINATAQGIRVSRTVCVDTDCATDDMLSIALLLSSKDTEVLSINSTSGALSSKNGSEKIIELLSSLHHEGIPVGCGEERDVINPPFRPICQKAHWGEKDTLCKVRGESADVLKKSISSSVIKPYVVALGPLTNVEKILLDNKAALRIREIVWYDQGKGFNYRCDSISAKKVMESGVPIRVISCPEDFMVSERFKKMLHRVGNPYSAAIEKCLASVSAAHHIPMADEMTVLWVYFPQMFSVEKNGNVWYCTLKKEVSEKDIIRALEKIISGNMYIQNQIFSHFPTDKKALRDDVKVIADSIICRHGIDEWRSGVLTNELHGHLGIYAVVGMKMGIRAREYFCIGVDDMDITSFTTASPPQSCLNDGLQVSTGGTFGHGLIRLKGGKENSPAALFTFGEKKVLISLKPEIRSGIENDVLEVLSKNGGLTSDYWAEIRKLALRYWLEMNRYEMFDFSSPDDLHEKNVQNGVF